MQHWAVTTLGRGAVQAAAVVWPAKELARGQFAGRAACVGEGGIFSASEMFLEMWESSLEAFSPEVFRLQRDNWNLNKNRTT